MTGHVWHGRAGAVVLGPTQDRVARYLADLTGHGWAHLRTAELAERLGLERSEAYRILARLRTLGLFGISNDRGGHEGGRRIWRTSRRHDGAQLDPARHKVAWSRIRGAARAFRLRARGALHDMRPGVSTSPRPVAPASVSPIPPGLTAPALTFAELVLPGLGAWFHEGRRT